MPVATDAKEQSPSPPETVPYGAAAPVTVPTAPASRETAARAARGEGKRDYVQQMFSDIAPRYDLLNHVLSLNIDKRWRRKALEALAWREQAAGTYLDLCAGTLDVGVMLSRQTDFRGHIVGADFAVPMLQHGQGKASPSVLTPVGADAMALPLANQSVNGAIVSFGIRNVSDLGAGLREVHRVLKPGARFVILEFSTPPNALIRTGYHAYFHHVLPRIGRLISGHGSAYTYLPMSVAQFPTGDALATELRTAGFRDVHWQSLTFGVAAIHVGMASHGDASSGDTLTANRDVAAVTAPATVPETSL